MRAIIFLLVEILKASGSELSNLTSTSLFTNPLKSPVTCSNNWLMSTDSIFGTSSVCSLSDSSMSSSKWLVMIFVFFITICDISLSSASPIWMPESEIICAKPAMILRGVRTS